MNAVTYISRRIKLMLTLLILLFACGNFPVFAQSRWETDFSEFNEDDYYIGGIGYWNQEDEFFVLTDLTGYESGRLFDLREYPMAIFTAEFDILVGGGSGADGMAFGWLYEYDYEVNVGGALDLLASRGFAVEFDCYSNNNYGDPNAQHIALLRDNVENHLAICQLNEGVIECNDWRHVEVTNFLGHVQVFWEGERIIDYEIEDYEPYMGYFGFTAGTGGSHNWHCVDNVSIIVGGPEMELSSRFIEFGPLPVDEAFEQVLTISNVSEDDDEWHSLSYIITELGEDPDWLDIDRELLEGEVAVGEQVEIGLAANTEGLEPGDYERTIRIETNDPDNLEVDIPVHIFVVEGFAQLSGVVTDFGENFPIEGALVTAYYFGFIAGSMQTDENGAYQFEEIPAWNYDLLVTMEDYLPDWRREVEIGPGDEVVENFSLCYALLVPEPAEVDVDMESDDELDFPLNVVNSGNGPLTWSVERVFPEGAQIDPWVYRDGFEAGEILDDNRMAGVEFVGDHFYLAGGANSADSSLIYILDREYNLVDCFRQFAETRYGMRDLAWDGRLLWGVDGNTVYGFTTDGNLVHELESPHRPGRYIACDPETGNLWISSVTTAIIGIDQEGNRVGELDRPPDTHIYGMSWFPEDPDGFCLYLFTNDGEYRQQVHKIDVVSGETAFITDLPDIEGARAGGISISGVWDPYSWVFIAMLDSPDDIAIWQLSPRTNWLEVAPVEGVVEAGALNELAVTLNTLGLPEEQEFTADLVFTHDGRGGQTVVPVTLFITGEGGFSSRTLHLGLLWNMVSLNVAPENDSILAVMRPLVEEDLLIMMKDDQGRFYRPDFGYNDIPFWNVASGYQVKVSRQCELEVEGVIVPDNTPIELLEGWQIVAYYPRDQVDAMLGLSGIVDNLLIAKDNFGHFYVPAFGFCDMDPLCEGQGYQLKMDADVDLVISFEEQQFLSNRQSSVQPDHYPRIAPTGNNMSVLVFTGSSTAGSEVAALSIDNAVVGTGLVDSGGRCGLAVWSDDPVTEDKDGLHEGEAFRLVEWNPRDRTETPLEVTGFRSGSELVYNRDGFVALEVAELNVIPIEYSLSQNYPNPFNSSTRISFGLPEAAGISLALFDLNGRFVKRLDEGFKQAGNYRVVLTAENMSSGVYVVRLDSPSYSASRKIVLLR